MMSPENRSLKAECPRGQMEFRQKPKSLRVMIQHQPIAGATIFASLSLEGRATGGSSLYCPRSWRQVCCYYCCFPLASFIIPGKAREEHIFHLLVWIHIFDKNHSVQRCPLRGQGKGYLEFPHNLKIIMHNKIHHDPQKSWKSSLL